MLCQLVCVDRRYQRMNCFNIRELQGILKRKFFTDLVNTSDSHTATESTLINMRHKNNMSNILLYDQSLLYNFDLTSTSKYKNFTFNPGKVYTYTALDTHSTLNFKTLSPLNSFYSINLNTIFPTLLRDCLNFIYIPTIMSLMSLLSSFKYLGLTLSSSLFFKVPNFFNYVPKIFQNSTNDTHQITNSTLSYNSSNINYSGFNELLSSSLSENASS
jgi:hypothetical protein